MMAKMAESKFCSSRWWYSSGAKVSITVWIVLCFLGCRLSDDYHIALSM